MNIEELRKDLAIRQKKGLPFIMASVILWTGIFIVWILPIQDVFTRNLFTFMCATPLVPIAYAFSKLIKAEFSVKNNPLSNLGLLFTANQGLYILIAMWAYSQAPYSMVMILAIIFGAHLLPYSWIYKSKAYFIMSIFIPLVMLIVGVTVGTERVYIIPLLMIVIDTVFSLWLFIEIRNINH